MIPIFVRAFPWTTLVSQYQKSNTGVFWILMKQETMAFWDSSGTSWTICKQPAPRFRQTRLLLTIVYVNKLYSLTCRQPWRHFITQFLWAWFFADAQPTLSPSLTNVCSSSDSLIHKTSIANIKKFTLHWAQLVSTEMIQKSVGGMENKWQPKFSLAVKAYPTCTWQGALECYREEFHQ